MKRDVIEAMTPHPVITISRQLGSGGACIADLVAKRLDCELVGYRIINEVAEKAEVRKEMAAKLDEKSRSQLDIWFDGLFNRDAIDDGEFHRLLVGAVRSFSEMGSVVILGRGAGMVEIHRPRVNVRVVAPMELRIQRVMDRKQCSRDEAIGQIDDSDTNRRRFIKKEFAADWDDALNYDFVINTGTIPIACAAAIIETAWLRYVTELGNPKQTPPPE